MPGPVVDAGTLGPTLSCRVSIIGAVTNSFSCDATAVYARGGPNNTTLSLRGNTQSRDPELEFTLRIPLEPEPGKTYGWQDDVLSSDLLLTHVPLGQSFLASKSMTMDLAAFSLRVNEVTGRVATANGGAQLRATYQLEVTLPPGPGSAAVSNARVSIAVTR